MRNLKKILALVLALMMVLSMMVTASATDFVDDADITAKYAEAVGVLAGIGVIRGTENEDGSFNFNPKGTLTRAQAATIIAYAKEGTLDNLDILVDGIEMPFTDVPEWAKVYVAYSYSEGIIIGRNATTFDPNGAITGFELGKMLLVACGFNTNEDFVTAQNWKVAVSEGLKNAGAWVGTDFKLSKELTREEACYLTFNMMNKSPAGTEVTYTVAGKVFTDLVAAYQYSQALVNTGYTGNATVITNEVPTDSLMASVFSTVTKVSAGNLGTDEFGRPVANKWMKGDKVVYLTYEEPLAVVTTGLDVTKTGTGEAWNGWTFPSTDDTVIYNGSVYDGDFAANLKAPGMTVELFGTTASNGTKVVDTIVAYEYYFAQITKVESSKITLKLHEAGAVINGGAATITVPAKAGNEYTDDYLALKDYAKDTVLALCVKQDWQTGGVNETWGANILDVKTPDSVEGAVTSATIKNASTTPVYSQSSITFNGDPYTFSSQYARQAIEVGAEGTLYTLNGLVIGFVGKTNNVTADKVNVFVVDHYEVKIPGVAATYDQYGTVLTPAIPDSWNIIAQCVTLDGEVVEYVVGNESSADKSGTATYTDNEKQVKLLTANLTTGIYAYGATEKKVATSTTLDATKISYVADGKTYYYNEAEYISILGAKAGIKVSEGTLAGSNAADNCVYIYSEISGTNNRKVTTVIYWDASASAPVADHVFYNAGTTETPVKTIGYYNQAGLPVFVYTYDVYENGVLVKYTTTTANLAEGVFQYYVDENGIGVESSYSANLVTDTVDNMYGSYMTISGVVTDYDISNVTIVDLTEKTGSSDKTGGNGKVDVGEEVMFFLVNNVIEVIYIITHA